MSNSTNARDASAWRSRTRAFFCSTSDGDGLATITVRRTHEGEQPFCGQHWLRLRAIATHTLECVQTRPRASSSRLGCGHAAIEAMRHLDRIPVIVREDHIHDLSWVTPHRWDQ